MQSSCLIIYILFCTHTPSPLPLHYLPNRHVLYSLQLIAVRGTLGSLKDWAASNAAATCLMSPFICFADFASQIDFNNSSKAGVLSSSIDAMVGRLNDLFLGVEQDGSSTC